MDSEVVVNRDCWIIIDNLPPLRESSDFTAYAMTLQEVSDKCAISREKPIVYIPHEITTDNYNTKSTNIFGCALIHFGQPAGAQTFYHAYQNNQPLAKQFGELSVYLWSDFKELNGLEDDYQRMSKSEFQDQNNLYWWLKDTKEKPYALRDQFVVRYKGVRFQETEIFWFDENVPNGRELCYDGFDLKKRKQVMTTLYVQWSPSGRYLVTFHKNGIQLWGGPHWKSMFKFNHAMVDRLSFSPNETKMVTCNSQKATKPEIKVWNLITGEIYLSIPHLKIGPVIKLQLPGWWPLLQFSYNDEYFCRITSSKGMSAKAKDLDKIQIYDSQSLKRIGDGSLLAPGLFNISFSPTDNLLAFTCQAKENDPAIITILRLPSRVSQKIQTLGFDVRMAHLYWQSQGRFIAIRIGHKFPKTHHIREHSIGIISVKQSQMPYSRISKFGKISFFSWETNNNRFACIHSIKEPEQPPKIFVSTYRVNVDGSPKLIWRIERRRPNLLSWAPFGSRMVVAYVDPHKANGDIEFFDLNTPRNSMNSAVEGIKRTHDAMTEVHWCPSGRYCITAALQDLNTNASGDDTGYIVWSYQGQKLFQQNIRWFYQFFWRHRCPIQLQLSASEQQAAKAHLKTWATKFQMSDYNTRHAHTNIKVRAYAKKKETYLKLFQSFQSKGKRILKERRKLLNLRDDDDEYEIRTKIVEIVKERKEFYVDKEMMKRILVGENVQF